MIRKKSVLAIILTVIYFIICCVSVLSIEINISYNIGFLLFLPIYFLPVVIVSNWYNIIKCYIKEQTKSNPDNNQLRFYIWLVIFILCLLGIVTFVIGIALMSFINRYREYLDNLVVCIVIRAFIFLLWLVLLIWYSKNIEAIVHSKSKKNKVIRFVILLLLICFSVGMISYTNYEADDEWIHGIVERHNQEYGIEK